MKQAINKIILCLLSIFSLVSCNLENNQILVEDLTLSTAKKYAKLYLNNVWKTDDMYGKYLSILAYYEKFNDKYYVLTFEYGSINPINGTFLEDTNREKIENVEFYWYHHFDVAIGRIFINDNIYTLTEAYQNKLISYIDIIKYHEYFRGDHFIENYYSPYVYKFINSLDRGVKYEKIKIIFITPLVLSLMSFQKNSQPLIYKKEIIVSIDESSDLTNKTKFIDFLNLNNIEYKSLDNLSENEYSKYYCFNFNNEKEYTTAFNNLKKLKEVIYVEENKIIHREENIENNVASVNNIQLSKSVNLKKPYELIQSKKAKELPGENNKINVAIIDAPVELNSPILKTKFDKTYSKKFNQNDSDKVNSERIFHGCAVSYIIGGTSNNSDYASGICENVNIIALTIPNIAEISDFVKIMNCLNNLPIDVPITNCSYSMGTDNSDIMKQSIMDYKGLFVCAASNDKINLDNPKNEVFPAMYSLDNMIVVGESNINDIKTDLSNYGKSNVDIFAPGHYIYSINEYDEFIPVKGTSFAAPLVTGTCALMLSKDSSLSLSEVKAKVMSYADKIDTLKDYCVDGNRLNVFSAVHRDNHQNTYLWKNTKKHLSTCTICDKQELEGHIVSGSTVIGNKRYSTCLLCKGEAEFGFVIETCALNSIDEYDFINGLFYPKKTQIVDGILDLSYEDSLKYEKNKILLSVLSLFLFTSCNTQNNIKEYDYNTYDKDRILVKDFTLNDARECARGIKEYCYNVNRFAIDIFYYLDKTTTEVSFLSYVKGYIIMAREFDPLDKMHEYIDLTQSRKEEINNKIYSWNKKNFNDDDLIPIFVTSKTVYTLGEAYNLNYIDDNNLTNISDLYYNHLDECKINIRFFSYNTF